ncbi:MAG: beta-ketoacyl-[acyl-carrier-protein] synthase II [Deltaproteobacteria bacterium]|nr:beta-ketoacyl-[acyl-carrier-protein] synthase II [Deltaproteobacteria bacterium]
MSRRVVVTGMGTITPHADDVDSLFDQLREGVSAVRRISLFDPEVLPCQVAAEVRYPVEVPDSIGPYDLGSRAMRFAYGAAERALRDSALTVPAADDYAQRDRRAVQLSVGVGSTAMEALGATTLSVWGNSDSTDDRPLPEFRRAAALEPQSSGRLEEWFLDQAAPALGLLLGAEHVTTAASACASGSHSLLDAAHAIRLGHADVVLCGGVCTPITRSMMPGFAMLSALTSRNDDPAGASRPFDRDRDGFIMAEGASVLVLESLEHAKERGARIHAEVLGVGIATDSYRLTDPEPTGRGMAAAMRNALADAEQNPQDIGYVNAHGTSTKLNDAAETLAIKQVFGDAARTLPVSSSKSMFGHLIHAAGVTEGIVCIQAMKQGVLPPTINYENPDPDCDLDYIPNTAREKKVGVVMNNSFGFGGQNVSVVLGAWEGGMS